MLETFIFIGRSGCGKGTQANLLIEKLKQVKNESVFYLETGEKFREFVKEEGYSNKLSEEIMKRGERQPDFLAVWNWARIFIDSLNGEENIIIDGTPRSLNEAMMFDTALSFYSRKPATVVYLNVSREWSVDRLTGRGRVDDLNISEVNKRLDWFDKDVLPAIEWYRTNKDYRFLDINGERPITDISGDIINRMEWQ